MTTFLSRATQSFPAMEGLSQGIAVSVVVAITGQFLSEHYGAPAMLMALLLGMAFHFLAEEGRCVTGIDFTAKTILRVGVALLGARISLEMLMGLGTNLILMVIAGVAATIFFALIAAKLLGRGWRLALLTGGSVAICGASAAMAIASILPKNEHSERNLLFTVLSVTVLSTVAMILYPMIAHALRFDDQAVGVFLGGTIHDVAQVVGAGFSVSEPAGDAATLVKLIRVSMLAPVILIFSLLFRGMANDSPANDAPLIPRFVFVFFLFAALNSIGLIPEVVSTFFGDVSRWALLTAIAAVGMKTSLKTIFDVGGLAIILITAETIFIGLFIVGGISYLG